MFGSFVPVENFQKPLLKLGVNRPVARVNGLNGKQFKYYVTRVIFVHTSLELSMNIFGLPCDVFINPFHGLYLIHHAIVSFQIAAFRAEKSKDSQTIRRYNDNDFFFGR